MARNGLKFADDLLQPRDSDIIILSDPDELPDPHFFNGDLQTAVPEGKVMMLQAQGFYK